MKIGILSFAPIGKKSNSDEVRLRNEARLRGHKADILRNEKFTIFFNSKVELFYNNRLFKKYDIIVPRASVLSNIHIRTALLEQFALLNIPVINKYYPTLQAKNKLHTLQILSYFGLPVIETAMFFNDNFLDPAMQKLGDPPFIVKTSVGSLGKGVVVIESKRSLKSAYSMFRGSNDSLLLQKYVKESKGKDIRVIVIGSRVVAAMQRKARRGEFRSNLHIGGAGKKIDIKQLPEELKISAIKATKVLNLDYSGVDMMITNKGPVIVEVNANPGLQIEEITGINIARKIIIYSEKIVKQFIPSLPTVQI